MRRPFLYCLLSIVLLLSTGSAAADVLILKSGEMFETRKAWEEGGVVHYFRNNREVRVDASQVERLIHAPLPVKPAAPQAPEPPAPVRSSPFSPPVAGPGPPALPSDAGTTGFVELKWGSPPSQRDGLKLVETDPAYGGVEQYVHQPRTDHFGRASVDNVYYGFWKGGLYTILVEVSNYLDFSALKAEAFRRYGEGQREAASVDRYRWRDDPTTDRFLSFDGKTKTGYLWMRSKVLQKKVSALYPE